MGNSAGFWNRFAKRYAKSPVADQAAYQKKLMVTQSYFRPEMEVLEIGCGTGTTTITHAPHVAQILATDFSDAMVQIARDKAAKASLQNVTFQIASVDDLDTGETRYDVVMAHSLLHLLNDRRSGIDTAFRLLKPGGFFVSNTVCIGSKFHVMKLLLPIGSFLGLLPLVRFFTASELVASMKDAGFEIDYQWIPDAATSVFLVAKKPA